MKIKKEHVLDALIYLIIGLTIYFAILERV